MYLLPYLPEASVILGGFYFLQNLLQFSFSRCFPSEESAWTALCWHQGKRTPWNYASELTEQELETSLTFRETSAAPDKPSHNPPAPIAAVITPSVWSSMHKGGADGLFSARRYYYQH